MIISCILCQAQYRVPALTLVNSEASAYAFIDKSFAQHHDLPLHPLTYPRRLCEFNGQPALTGDITHVAETILALGNYVEKLFLYVISLNQYLIILGLFWLCCHVINANFGFNTLIMFLPFCLTHCCHTSVTISGATWEEEVFLFSKESQQVWELEDQENQSLSDNSNLVTVQPAYKKQLSTQSACREKLSSLLIWKGQSSRPIELKRQFDIQSAHKEQPGIQSAHREKFSSPLIWKGQSSCSIELKRQFDIQFTHKEQLSPQSVQKEQSDALIIQKGQSSSPGAQREQPDIQLNLKEKSPSCILQVIQKGYLLKIKYCSPASRWTSTERRAHQAEWQQPPIQLNIAELGAHGFDHVTWLKESEVFSILLHELDAFLGISDPALFQLSSHVQSLLIPCLDQKILTSVHDIKSHTHAEDHHHALY